MGCMWRSELVQLVKLVLFSNMRTPRTEFRSPGVVEDAFTPWAISPTWYLSFLFYHWHWIVLSLFINSTTAGSQQNYFLDSWRFRQLMWPRLDSNLLCRVSLSLSSCLHLPNPGFAGNIAMSGSAGVSLLKICMLFLVFQDRVYLGQVALEDPEHWESRVKLAIKYLISLCKLSSRQRAALLG